MKQDGFKKRGVRGPLCKVLFIFLVLGFSLTVFSSISFAATKYWIGSSNGANWNVNGNWSTTANSACSTNANTTVPASGDTVVFTSSCTNGVTLDVNPTVTVFTVNSGYTGTIATGAGSTISISGNATFTTKPTMTGVTINFINGTNAVITCSTNLNDVPAYDLNGDGDTLDANESATDSDGDGTYNENPIINFKKSSTSYATGISANCKLSADLNSNAGTIGNAGSQPLSGVLIAYDTDTSSSTWAANFKISSGGAYIQRSAADLSVSSDFYNAGKLDIKTYGTSILNIAGDYNNTGGGSFDRAGITINMINGTNSNISCSGNLNDVPAYDLNGDGDTLDANESATDSDGDGTYNENPIINFKKSSTSYATGISANCKLSADLNLNAGSIGNAGAQPLSGVLIAYDTDTSSSTWAANFKISSGGAYIQRSAADLSVSSDFYNAGKLDIKTYGTSILNIAGDYNNTGGGSFDRAGITINMINGTNSNISCSGNLNDVPAYDLNGDGDTLDANESATDSDGDGTYNENPIINFNKSSTSYVTGISTNCKLSADLNSNGGTIGNAAVYPLSGVLIAYDTNTGTDTTTSALKISSGGAYVQASNANLSINDYYNAGKLDITTYGTSLLKVMGDFDNSGGGTFNRTGVTINMVTGATAVITCSGNFNDVTDADNDNIYNENPIVNLSKGTSYTTTISANCPIYMNLDSNTGHLTVNGSLYATNLLKSNNLTVASGALLSFPGSSTITGTKTINGGSTITYRGDGDGAADTYNLSTLATTYGTLVINSADGNTDVFNAGATLTTTNLTITNGKLTLGGNGLTVSSTFSNDGTLSIQGGETVSITNDTNSGTIEYVGTSTYNSLILGNTYYNLTLNGSGGVFKQNAALDVNNNLTITAGTLNAQGNNTTVGGNFSNAGTYTSGSNTFILDTVGNTSTITGSTTFNNFSVTTAAKPIVFTAGSTTRVDGTLTLTGSAGNLISLRSSSNGSAWNLDANATKNVSYVDVKDSDATLSSTSIDPTNSTNSGNLTNWNFNPSVTLSRNNATIAENGGTSTITATLSAANGVATTIDLSYSGTATNTSDYTRSAAQIVIAAGSTTGTVTLTGVNDNLDEAAETIVTDISSVTNGTESGTQQVQVDITDDDAAPTVAFNASTSNGSEATAAPTIAVDLSTASGQTVTVDYAVTGGTATSGGTDFTLASGQLSFAAGETSKNITLSVVDDTLDENNETVAVAISNPTNSSLGATTTHTYTINDNDSAPTVTLSRNNATLAENGGTSTVTATLSAASGLDVTIDLSYSGTATNTSDYTRSGAQITITAGNTTGTVTLTGVDDATDDDDETIITDITSVTNGTEDGTQSVNVTITDDDSGSVAGITVSAISGNTTEAGGTATFTVVLDSVPTDDVTIGISSDDTGEGTVSAASLTFTAANWDTPQTITVTGVNDDLDDGDINYNIVTAAATSNDGNYNTMNAANVAVTNTDNDASGFTVGAISGHTTEAGGTATFTVKLTAQPTADVTIGISSDDTTEGTVNTASLTFTSVNWNSNQTITITGVNDSSIDGNIGFNIITDAAVSDDINYNTLNPANVAVTNDDNDTATMTITQSGGTTVTTEAGGTDSFTIVLNSQPTDDVTIGISSDDTGEGTVSAASLTFTSANWNTPQTITVTGVNDDLDDGDISYNILTAAATSNDSNYNTVNAADVSVSNTDNDAAGFTIGAISGHTTEAGGTATFTVKLATQPTDDVTIGISSDDTDEGSVSPASLIFTSANWNSNQTVTITGVDDILDDGDVAFSIITAAATSNDTNFNNLNPADVAVINDDDDNAPGITVSAISGNTTEIAGTATFTVVLDSEPADDVSIGISSDDTSEGTVSAASLTFTPANWDTPQTITVTGVNDDLDDGDIAYHILTAAAVSNDPNYNTLDADDVDVSNTDNDASGFTLGAISGHTTEGGTTATFTVKLTAQPTANVTIGISSDDTGEGTVNTASLTFTSVNWNSNQTITVTGVNDNDIDGNIAFNIITDAAVSDDTNYNTLNPSNVAVTNDDNDTAGITVSAISGNTTEAGGTATFTVVLDTQPSDDVTIGISSDDTGEGTVSAASLTFTSGNWNIPQTITVTGVNDDIDDGDINYNIITAAATSNDSNYNGVNAANVSATNIDNDTAGFTIGAISGNTTEAGGTATFTVKLATQPTDDVTIEISSDDTGEGTVSAASLTFTSVNWNSNQTITVTGVNDSIIDGDVAFNVVTAAATSNDTNYNNLNPANVAVTNDDNDSAGITVTQSGGTTVVTEAGGTDSFTVVLTAQPSDDVTIGISSDDTGEGTVSAASLTFTSGNWNTPQTITVTGVNDSIIDGNVSFNVITAAASSNDSNFNGVNAADVTATNNDNDTAGVTVSAISGHTVEDGTTATFTVVLTAQPLSDVAIDLTSTDTGEGTVSPASLTFTNGNWNTPQTVTVTGVDDVVSDGNQNFTITTSVTTSADSNFNNLAVGDVSVTNDDDEAAATLSVNDVSLTEGNSGTSTLTFTISLNVASADTITVDYATSNGTATAGSDYTSGSGTLTFNAGETSKTVNFSVTGDTVDEVNETFNLVLSNGSVTISDSTGVGTITDNDSATISVADVSVGEGDGLAVVTVTLATTSDRQVTVEYATSNGTASSASDYVSASGTLTFDTGETSKTFNVTVNDDSIYEANETITVTLSSATNTTISDATGTITITDDDGSPTLSVNDVSVAENVVAGKATFTVTLSSASEQSVTVEYATSNATATAGSDYTAASGTLTFTAGQTIKTFDVTVSNDSTDENNETYTVTLSNATNATISDATGTGTITNDDAATLSVADTSVGEEDGTATVTVSLSNASAQQVTVNFATSNGTASSASDYTSTSGTLTFEANETSKTFNITIADDSTDEANETITVTLSGPSGATISDATGSVTITDDDSSPSLSINDVSVTENDVGGTASFTVTLSATSGRSVTVDYATANNTATAVSDYTATSGTLTFNAGETTKTINVSFSDDGVNEANETFLVNLSNASNATISDNQGNGTINNDDTAPGLSVADASAGESDGTVTITVTLASAVGQQVTVDYATSNGTATASSDYTAASGTLTFAAGETSKTFDINVTSDTTDEPDENLTVTLSNATVASIADSTATVTITDDDAAPSLSIDDVSVGESGSASFTVDLSAASGKTVTVNYTTSNGTATSGADYSTASGTLTFTAGQTTKNITVPILSDAIDENNETINVTLSSATNASISDNQGVATITDDDTAPTVALSGTPASIAEASGSSTVTATLSAVSGLNVTVNLAYTGTATENTDYTVSSTSITINAGGTTGTATLTATDDGVVDAAETIDVDIDSVSNGSESGTQQVSVTITDDDSYALNITQSGGSTNVTEGTGSDTFTITLDSAPLNDVDITLTPGSDLSVDDTTLTFTSGNWNVPQTVTVTAVDDAVNEGAHTDTITYVISSADNNYDTLSGTAVTANITDNDTPGVTVTESSGSTNVTEGGSTDTYTIVLASQPTDDVTISLSSSAQVSRSSASVVFTSANWNTPQTLTLTAINDSVAEGNHNATINHTVTSNDGGYDGISVSSISVGIVDNDSAGITVTQSGGSTGITEGSTTDTYTIVLTSEPTHDVSVSVTGTAQANVSTSSMTFTTANWNTPQTVTVTAVNDAVAEGNHNTTITHSATSTDTNYNGASISSVVAAITDNDSAGISVTESGGSSAVTEGGATDTYTVVLTSEPTNTVTVTVNNTSQATTTPTILTFTTANWNTPQTVTITASNDNVAEGGHNTTLTHTSSSSDTNYNAITINDVVTSVTDNDSAGVSVTQSGGTTTVTEGGATDTYTVVLTSEPTNTVTVTLTHSAQITLSTETLTFGVGNWNTPQIITVTANNDSVAEGSLNTTITQTASSSDINYNNIAVGSVVTTITDNDSAGVSVTASGGTTVISESGTSDTYTVVLTSEPTNNVVVTVVSTSEATASPSTLTFTTGNWSTPQTVTVSAVDDSVEELDPNTTITHTVASGDTNYNGISVNSILAEITNNDTHGVTITESDDDSSVSEDGTSDTYTVVLASRPTHDVTITPTVDSDLSVSLTSLTFTTTNWNTPQTVTVTAVNDDVVEGEHTSSITHSVVSDDSQYDEETLSPITVTISDNDVEDTAPDATIIGHLTVGGGSTRTYTAADTTNTSYSWTITGDGVIVGETTGSSVQVLFSDTSGSANLTLSVSKNAQSASSTVSIIVTKATIITTDSTLGRYEGVKVTGATSDGSLIVNDAETVDGRGNVSIIDFDSFRFYGLSDAPLLYKIDTINNVVFIGDATANNNTGIVYRIPFASASGDIQAWNLPGYVKTREGQAEGDKFGYEIVVFDDKVAIHAPGLRIIAVYSNDLTHFLSLVNEADNVPLGTNVFMQAEDFNGDSKSELFVGGKYTSEDTSVIEESLGLSVTRAIELDITMPEEGEVKAVEGQDEWESDVSLNEADATFNSSEQFYSSDVGDFNGDGTNDLVVSSMNSCSAYVFFGTESIEAKT